jgi:hypothetical protein
MTFAEIAGDQGPPGVDPTGVHRLLSVAVAGSPVSPSGSGHGQIGHRQGGWLPPMGVDPRRPFR